MVWRDTTFALMSLQRCACCRCAASNCCPGLVSSQYFNFDQLKYFDVNQVHMPLICIQLVGLSQAFGCCSPLRRVVSAALRMMGVISIASGRLE
eukprot:262671-Pelagomonas_calceolata.AAC.1